MGKDAGWPSTQSSLLIRIREPANAEAWKTFVDLYTPLIYRYCRKRGLQDADARDAAQEVLSRVIGAIRKFEYDPARGRFRGWLGLLTRQALYRHGKEASRRDGEPWTVDVESEADPEWIEEFNARVYRCAIERIRAEFDDDTWNAFDAVWTRDEKPANVAHALGRRTPWIYKAKFKVLKRLKEEVEYLAADLAVLTR
jgi:RNA polymerase sigma-70 factor, ECF subfamily